MPDREAVLVTAMLPPSASDRVWGVDAIEYVMKVVGYNHDAAVWRLQQAIDAGKLRVYRRLSGRRERKRDIPSNFRLEHYFVRRADLLRLWPAPPATSIQPKAPEPPAAPEASPKKKEELRPASAAKLDEHVSRFIATIGDLKWKSIDKDLVPLVKQQLSDADLSAGRDRIRESIRNAGGLSQRGRAR